MVRSDEKDREMHCGKRNKAFFKAKRDAQQKLDDQAALDKGVTLSQMSLELRRNKEEYVKLKKKQFIMYVR